MLEQIRRMKEFGRELLAHGFQYDPFAEACNIYWGLVVQDTINFSAEDIKLVDPTTLEDACDRQGLLDYLRMYRLLPKWIQEKLTFEEMIRTEQRSLGGFLAAFNSVGVLTGVYNHHDDQCYVLETIPPENIRSYTV